MKYEIDALPILEFGKVVKVIFWKYNRKYWKFK